MSDPDIALLYYIRLFIINNLKQDKAQRSKSPFDSTTLAGKAEQWDARFVPFLEENSFFDLFCAHIEHWGWTVEKKRTSEQKKS